MAELLQKNDFNDEDLSFAQAPDLCGSSTYSVIQSYSTPEPFNCLFFWNAPHFSLINFFDLVAR